MSYRPELYDTVTPPAFQGDVQWYRRKPRAAHERMEAGEHFGKLVLAIPG